MNLNRYNLKNTLKTEHLRDSGTIGKRKYAGILEWVKLFLSSLRLKKIFKWLSQKKIQPISRSGFAFKTKVSLKANWFKGSCFDPSLYTYIHLGHKHFSGYASFYYKAKLA